ncbi:CvpA family protein [Aristophania vespae]|uniref:CvpA family protein n=1 Tax=Aristophania vespae TaxID=2697033 RepID=UPI0023517B54|nr:CvpA family protein [Aristophania vespae]UMM64451.1 hypothetical protein DM15PD_14650 [Aristophania vespae]
MDEDAASTSHMADGVSSGSSTTTPPGDLAPNSSGSFPSESFAGGDHAASANNIAIPDSISGHYPAGLAHHLTSFDIACLILVGVSALWGLLRGGAKEITGVLVWIGALWLSFRSSNAALAWVNPSLPTNFQNSEVALWGVRIAIFMLGMILLNALVERLSYMARSVLSRGVDTLLGFVFGFIRGYALMVIACMVASWISSSWLQSVTEESNFAPYLMKGVQILQGYVPPSLESYLALPNTNSH